MTDGFDGDLSVGRYPTVTEADALKFVDKYLLVGITRSRLHGLLHNHAAAETLNGTLGRQRLAMCPPGTYIHKTVGFQKVPNESASH